MVALQLSKTSSALCQGQLSLPSRAARRHFIPLLSSNALGVIQHLPRSFLSACARYWYMSFHDIDPCPSDSDDTTELQRRSLTRSLVAFDPRQAQSRGQAHRHPTLTNYGNVTFVKVYQPVQYNTGPGSGTQGYLTTMCKSIAATLLTKWRRLMGRDSSCTRSPWALMKSHVR